MTGIYQVMLFILKAFLNDQNNIDIPVDIDRKKYNRLAEINFVSGIVGYMFQQADLESVPEKIRRRYENDFLSTIDYYAR